MIPARPTRYMYELRAQAQRLNNLGHDGEPVAFDEGDFSPEILLENGEQHRYWAQLNGYAAAGPDIITPRASRFVLQCSLAR
ncbi:hypothetical protein [Rhodoglobus aureus]|uniref:Uncharacterized protein n=1 Tax=Rhodoglobus aureus TaxID=191497 RepID=A0ABN1VLF5_9MICO